MTQQADIQQVVQTASSEGAASDVTNQPGQNDPGNSQINSEQAASAAENNGTKSQEEPRLSSKFAALSRKDKELRNKERALKEQEAALKQWQESQKLLQENPLAFVEKSGLSLDKLIALALQQPGEQDPMQKELAAVKQKIEGWDKQYEDALKAHHAAVEAQAEADSKASIRSFIEAAKDKYELIAVNDAIDDVYDLIYEDWVSQDVPPEQRTPMSLDKAAQAVEDYYFEEAQKFLKANKIRAALQPGSQEDKANPGSQATQTVNRDATASGNRVEERHVARFESQEIRPGLPPTLTNNRTAASSAGAPRAPISNEESLKRAVSLLKFS